MHKCCSTLFICELVALCGSNPGLSMEEDVLTGELLVFLPLAKARPRSVELHKTGALFKVPCASFIDAHLSGTFSHVVLQKDRNRQ